MPVRTTRRMWVNESTVFGTITEEAEKDASGSPRRASLLPRSHGSLFLSPSLNFHTVNILSLGARGELWRRSKFAQIR